MKPTALLFLPLFLLVLAGCQTKHASPVNLEAGPNEPVLRFTLPSQLSTERIVAAAESALRGREWEQVQVDGNEVTASLVHRGIDASLRMRVEGSTVAVYSDSWRLDKEGARKEREHPEGWIRNLEKDIRESLGAPLVTD